MQFSGSLSILWHCLSLGLEWKLTFSSPVATAEFSKFAGIQQALVNLERTVNIRAAKDECSSYRTTALTSHASKVMLKILQARLQQYWSSVNRELPDVQAGFRKGRGARDQLPTSAGSYKKQESSRKTSISALLTVSKPLTMRITTNCGKFFKRWEYQTINLPPEKSVCRSRSNS